MEINKQSPINSFLAAGIFFVLFLQLIVMILLFDVDSIGPAGTEIGFSHMNAAFHELTGTSYFWYNLTDFLGYIAILVVAVFALIGAVQLFTRKNLLKVDREILLMGRLYLLIFILYAGFEVVKVNRRPVLMEGETFPEASFPSSHTMMTLVVMASVIIMIGYFVKNRNLVKLIKILSAITLAVALIGRLICGMHWLTDIIGGVLITLALMFAFYGLKIKYIDNADYERIPGKLQKKSSGESGMVSG